MRQRQAIGTQSESVVIRISSVVGVTISDDIVPANKSQIVDVQLVVQIVQRKTVHESLAGDVVQVDKTAVAVSCIGVAGEQLGVPDYLAATTSIVQIDAMGDSILF